MQSGCTGPNVVTSSLCGTCLTYVEMDLHEKSRCQELEHEHSLAISAGFGAEVEEAETH